MQMMDADMPGGQSSLRSGVVTVPRPRVFPLKGTAPGPRCGHTLTTITGPDGDVAKARLVLFGGATALEGSSSKNADGTAPASPGPAASGIRLAGATNDVHLFERLQTRLQPRAACSILARASLVPVRQNHPLRSRPVRFVVAMAAQVPTAQVTAPALDPAATGAKAVIQQVIVEFAKGNIPGALEHLADDVHLWTPGTTALSRDTRGRDAVAEWFGAIFTLTEVHEVQITRIIAAEHPFVIVEGINKETARATGKPIVDHFVWVVTVNEEGKVDSFKDYFNTQAVAEALQ